VAGTGAFIGGAAYISQHPSEMAYIRENFPQKFLSGEAIEFYKTVVGGELLATSLLLLYCAHKVGHKNGVS
jgi:hypothetical protein